MLVYFQTGVVDAINTIVNTPAAESVFYKPFVDRSCDISPDEMYVSTKVTLKKVTLFYSNMRRVEFFFQ